MNWFEQTQNEGSLPHKWQNNQNVDWGHFKKKKKKKKTED